MATIQKRGISLLLVLVLMLGMIPSVSAAEIDTQSSTEPAETTTPVSEETYSVQPTSETTPSEQATVPELQDADGYTVSSVSASKIGLLSNCDHMNIILSNGSREGWHFVDEDQSRPWDYMNMIYCLEDNKEFCFASGLSGDSNVPLDGTVTDSSTIGQSCWYNFSKDQRAAIALVLLYGCPNKLWDAEWGLNPDGHHYMNNPNIGYRFATQVLVWEFASEYRSATPPYERRESYWYDLSVGMCVGDDGTDHFLYAYNSILADIMEHDTIPSFTGSSPDSAPVIQLEGPGITLSDTNRVVSDFSFSSTDSVNYSKSDDTLIITLSSMIPDDVQSAYKEVPDPETSVYELWYNKYNSNYQTAIKVSLPETAPVMAYFKLNVISSALTLTKTTEDGKKLSGWSFGIYSDLGCTNLISGPHTTDERGIISLANLPAGTVYIKELGHEDDTINSLYSCSSTNPLTVVLTAGEAANVSFHNTLNIGNAKLVKQTNTGINLGGWLIGLYYDADCINAVSGSPFTTGTDGSIIVTGLKPGMLYAKELPTDAPYWEFDTSVKEVEIVANQTTTVTFTNTHYGRLNIRKTMDSDGPLDGWQFRVTDASGKEITGSPFTSDKNGEIHVGNILPGVYKIEELIPADSLYYCKSENPQTVTVKQGETTEVSFTNALRPGKLTIEKVDLKGEHLAGAKFLLEWSEDGSSWYPIVYSDSKDVLKGSCSNPNVVDGTLTTSESGIIEWDNLHPGLYYRITELDAPEGYVLLTEVAYEGKLPADNVEVVLRVINCEEFTLPKTGSRLDLFLRISRILCITVCGSMLLFFNRKKRRT